MGICTNVGGALEHYMSLYNFILRLTHITEALPFVYPSLVQHLSTSLLYVCPFAVVILSIISFLADVPHD